MCQLKRYANSAFVPIAKLLFHWRTAITRKVGDAYFEFQGEGGAAPVIFGEPGDEPLLGATTLESIGLVLDPFKRRLIPMRMILA